MAIGCVACCFVGMLVTYSLVFTALILLRMLVVCVGCFSCAFAFDFACYCVRLIAVNCLF